MSLLGSQSQNCPESLRMHMLMWNANMECQCGMPMWNANVKCSLQPPRTLAPVSHPRLPPYATACLPTPEPQLPLPILRTSSQRSIVAWAPGQTARLIGKSPRIEVVGQTQIPNHAFPTDGARVTTTTSNNCQGLPRDPPASVSTPPSASASPPRSSPAPDETAAGPPRWATPTTP